MVVVNAQCKRVWKVCIMLEKRITILFQISRAFIGSSTD